MAEIQSIMAKLLIQIGADEPKEIGTIEIPINISVAKATASQGFPIYAPGTR